MSRKKEQPGNAIGSQLEFERQMVRLATQLLRFERVLERLDDEGVWLDGLSVRLPNENRADVLVVVRARTEEGPKVAFMSSDSLADAIRKTVAQLENRSVRWKDDQYA